MTNQYETPEDENKVPEIIDQKMSGFDLKEANERIEEMNDRVEDLEHQEREDALAKIREFEARTGINTDKTEDAIEDKLEVDYEDKIETLEIAEKVRGELIDHISRPEYLAKLVIEYEGNEEKAKEDQAKRIENLETAKITVMSLQEINDKFLVGSNADGMEGTLLGAYDSTPDVHELFISPNDFVYSRDQVAIHELLHASTRGNNDITDNAFNLLDYSYKNRGFLGIFRNKIDSYYSDPTERLARKQVIDLELEKLGVKKYGEEFTDEHYEIMMDYYKKGKLSEDANDFIKRTKPADFKKVFNEIAKETEVGDISLAA